MNKYKVLCRVFQHGEVYGKKGDSVELPAAIGDLYIKSEKNPKPKLEKIADK